MTKRKLILEMFYFFLTIVILVIQIFISKCLKEINYQLLFQLTGSWTEFLMNFESFTETNCSNDSINKLESVYAWEGTVKGGKNFFGKTIRLLEADSSIYPNMINKTEKIKATVFNGKYLCYDELDEQLSYIQLNVSEKCDGTTDCGVIDTLGHHLCLESNQFESCPTKFNDTYYTNFKISENTPCLDDNYLNNETLHSILDLHYTTNTCPGNVVNTFAQKIESIDKSVFQNENFNTTLHQPNDTNYTYPTGTYNLYGQLYFGVSLNESCRKHFQNDLRAEFRLRENVIPNSINWNVICILLTSAFLLIFIVRIVVLFFRYKKLKEKMPKYVKPMLMIISILNFVLGIVFYTCIATKPEYLDLFKDRNCFDELVGPQVEKSFNMWTNVWYLSIANLVCEFVIIIYYGIRIAIKYAN